MPTTIKLKNSVTTTSAPSSLAQGEVAINVTDKKVWVGNAATTPVQLLGTGSDGNFSTITVTGNSYLATTSGNVGVGTVSPLNKLQVNGNISALPNTTTDSALVLATNAGGRIIIGRDSSTGGSFGLAYSANVWSDGAHPMLFWTNAAERMRITATGDVGIGTGSPVTKLDVSGALNSLQARFGNIAGRGLEISTFLSGGTNDGTSVLNAKGAGAGIMVFQTETTERLRIQADGNLVISGGTADGGKLTINGAAGQAGTGISLVETSAAARRLRIFQDTTAAVYNATWATGSNDHVWQNGNIERMRLDSNGNLSLGSILPAFTLGSGLQVQRAGIATVRVNNTTNAVIAEFNAFNDSALLYTMTGHPLLFGVGGTERMRINVNGTVILQNGNNGANGTGITFPATQNQSTNANTLDDYEEGIWTPVLTTDGTAPTLTYTEQSGTYVKIGQLVQATCRTRVNVTAGGTGSPRITGLPFPSDVNTLDGVAVGLSGAISGVTTSLGLWFVTGSIVICANGAGYIVATGPYVTFTITYRTAS